MIDVSDGLGLDLRRLAMASGVGVRIEEVPVADGATEAQAMGGGDDYELIFTAPAHAPVNGIRIGVCTDDPTKLPDPAGWEHAAVKVALTIAGTDSSGGAGVAADLKTFAAHDVWGAWPSPP